MSFRNEAFQKKWGDEFENVDDYPIWNYFIKEYPCRFKEDYFDTLYVALKERFELLGAFVEIKISGVRSVKENKKNKIELFVSHHDLDDKISQIKNKIKNTLKAISAIEADNQNIASLNSVIDKNINLISLDIIDSIENIFVDKKSEEKSVFILNSLLYLLDRVDNSKIPHFKKLLNETIENYKQKKLYNEQKIFSERHPKKIFIKVGDDISEIYTSNLIAVLQEEFKKNIVQLNKENKDIFSKKTNVIKFARKIAKILDFSISEYDLSGALLYVIDSIILKSAKKEAAMLQEKLVSPAQMIYQPFHIDALREISWQVEADIQRVRELCQAGNKRKLSEPAVQADSKKNQLSPAIKTALYVASGILLGVGIIAAFVLGGGLPLIMGFLAIHLIHVAPLAIKLMLVVGGMLIGGGVGYGSKKVSDIVEAKCKNDAESSIIVAPLVDLSESPRAAVIFKDHASTATLGVFHRSSSHTASSTANTGSALTPVSSAFSI